MCDTRPKIMAHRPIKSALTKIMNATLSRRLDSSFLVWRWEPSASSTAFSASVAPGEFKDTGRTSDPQARNLRAVDPVSSGNCRQFANEPSFLQRAFWLGLSSHPAECDRVAP